MNRLTFLICTAVLGAAVALSLQPGLAQDDGALVAGQAPDPELCSLNPRTIEEIEQLMDDPALADVGTPTRVSDPFEMPEGFSLFEEERAEVEKDLVRAVACFNTGDPLHVFSTFTDRHVVALIDGLGGLTEEVVAGLESVRPLEPDEYVTILSIGDAVLIDDGRIAILVLGDDLSDDDPPGRRLFLLEEVLPGRWLIDEVIEIDDLDE